MIEREEGAQAGEDRERRLALNEALARDVNELVDDVASGWFDPEEPVEFRCECVRLSCAERVRLTRSEYASVRADPLTLVVHAGHESTDLEDVVGRLGDYVVVRKKGPGAETAKHTAPDPP